MILLIDNYDSFSYNLYQMIGTINPDIRVVRNDLLSVDDIAALAPTHIVLSPGPGRPEDAGVCMQVARTLSRKIPTLGVCLGHQAICESYGLRVGYAKQLMHGKQSLARINTSSKIFQGLNSEILVARYHSLAADELDIPDILRVTATSNDGEIMAIEHKDYPIYGVQFHPESILTPEGKKIIENFLS
jgi:anthranilate synthase component 2